MLAVFLRALQGLSVTPSTPPTRTMGSTTAVPVGASGSALKTGNCRSLGYGSATGSYSRSGTHWSGKSYAMADEVTKVVPERVPEVKVNPLATVPMLYMVVVAPWMEICCTG